MKNNLTLSLQQFGHKAIFQLKKHSPTILLVVGIGGAITSTVLACRATVTAKNTIEDAKEDIKVIKDEAQIQMEENQELQIDTKKEINEVIVQSGLELAKLYAPAVIIGALSITSIISSNVIVQGRNMALASAYTAMDNSYRRYRKNVVERFGPEIDKQLSLNMIVAETTETVTNEKGEEETITKTEEYATSIDEHARFFDELCPGWTKNPEYNLLLLRSQQQYINNRLIKKGYVFLNEVYDLFDIPRTAAGQTLGWIRNKDVEGYIDFGIYDDNGSTRAFVNGRNDSVLLTFNVQGNILHALI